MFQSTPLCIPLLNKSITSLTSLTHSEFSLDAKVP